MFATSIAGVLIVTIVVSMRSLKPPGVFVLCEDNLGGGATRAVVGVGVTLSSYN